MRACRNRQTGQTWALVGRKVRGGSIPLARTTILQLKFEIKLVSRQMCCNESLLQSVPPLPFPRITAELLSIDN
jgi:hypothetical protein